MGRLSKSKIFAAIPLEDIESVEKIANNRSIEPVSVSTRVLSSS